MTVPPGLPGTTQVHTCCSSITVIYPSQKCFGLNSKLLIRRLYGESGYGIKWIVFSDGSGSEYVACEKISVKLDYLR